eukprot:Pgem_evm1s15283
MIDMVPILVILAIIRKLKINPNQYSAIFEEYLRSTIQSTSRSQTDLMGFIENFLLLHKNGIVFSRKIELEFYHFLRN